MRRDAAQLAQAIRELCGPGVTDDSIANQLDVSRKTVWRIRTSLGLPCGVPAHKRGGPKARPKPAFGPWSMAGVPPPVACVQCGEPNTGQVRHATALCPGCTEIDARFAEQARRVNSGRGWEPRVYKCHAGG